MTEKNLPPEAPGTYIPYGVKPYYSPEKLPPEKDIVVDDTLRESVEDAIYQLGVLEGISEETDTNPIVYTSLVRREAVESVLIEGAEIQIEDLFRPDTFEADEVTKDVQEGLNYEVAVHEGTEALDKTGEITLDILKDLHRRLLKDTRDEGDTLGEFRDRPVHIPAPDPASEPFIPPAPKKVPELMRNLERYIQNDSSYHNLLDIGIVHYQIETIHPFSDGNGRLGRLLITLQLIYYGYLTKPYLYPSAYFNEHKLEYVKKLRAVSEEGRWEEWLRFFVDGIRQQAKEAAERTDELRELRREYEIKYGDEKTAKDRLAMRLFRHPYLTTKDVQEILDVSSQTARNAIRSLEKEGVLQETTGKERYQEYKAVDIFNILNQPFGE